MVGEEISKRKGSYRGSFCLLFLYFPEEVLSGSGEVLELENPGIIPWEILFGVPRRSPEALQPPVLLEPTGQITGKTNHFTHQGMRPAPSVVCHLQRGQKEQSKASQKKILVQREPETEARSPNNLPLHQGSAILFPLPAQAHPLPPTPASPGSLRA